MRARDQFVPGKSVHSLYISFVLSDGMKLPLGIFFITSVNPYIFESSSMALILKKKEIIFEIFLRIIAIGKFSMINFK